MYVHSYVFSYKTNLSLSVFSSSKNTYMKTMSEKSLKRQNKFTIFAMRNTIFSVPNIFLLQAAKNV